MDQAARCHRRVAGTPVDEVCPDAGRVEIAHDLELGLQQVGRAHLARIAGELSLLGVDQAVTMLAKVDFMEWNAGWNWCAGHHLGDGRQDAGVVLGSLV